MIRITMVVRFKRIPFFGNIIDADGIEPYQENLTPMCNKTMAAPIDLKELQTFIGLANYLGRFTPHLATLSATLSYLCNTNVPYDWGPEHDAAFSNLKKAFSNEALRYYDSTNPLVIQVDASQRGLMAAQLQANGHIAFASQSLTETESRYYNIERKMLGTVFGLERFHQYVYRQHMEVYTDHTPLESIYTKHLFAAPPRLARMLLRIQQYDVTIKYVPGCDVKPTYALSRVNPSNTGPIRGIDLSVHEVHMNLKREPNSYCGNSHGNIERQYSACAKWDITRLARGQSTLLGAFDVLLEWSRRTEY